MNPLLGALLWNTAVAGVLALLVVGVGRFIKRPAVRHVLWLLVLAKLVTPPLVEVAAIPNVFESAEVPIVALPAGPVLLADRMAPIESAPTPVPWATVVLIVMLAGALVVGLVGTIRIVRFSRALSLARPAPQALRRRMDVLAAWCGLRRAPAVRIVDAPVPPMIWLGLGGAEVVLPARLLERLDFHERDAVVLHELTHLRRLDPWIRPLEWVVAALFWWNPLVPWCRRRLRIEEERSCDAEVVRRLPGRARPYAEGLLKTLEFLADAGRPVPAWSTGMATTRKIEERLEMILKSERPRRLSGWQRLLLAALALSVLILVPAFRSVDAEPAPGEVSEKSEELREIEREARERMLELEARQGELEREIQELRESRTRVELDESRHREARALKLQLERARAEGNLEVAEELERFLKERGLARVEVDEGELRRALEREMRAEDELHRALELERDRDDAARLAAEAEYRRALELAQEREPTREDRFQAALAEYHRALELERERRNTAAFAKMNAEQIRQRMVELERELERLARMLAEKEDGQLR